MYKSGSFEVFFFYLLVAIPAIETGGCYFTIKTNHRNENALLNYVL
jgi:hypothetical protein